MTMCFLYGKRKTPADTVAKFPVDIQPFKDMIEGMRMDLRKSRYKNFDELYLYCYYVAGTVGLMSVPVMGISRDSQATTESVYNAALALRITNQLANIVRDVGEEQVEADICEQTQSAKESDFILQKNDYLEMLKNKEQSPKVSKKKSKKGGLSMFLSGALDDVPKEVALPPPTPKNEGPAWGGPKFLMGSATLREIQDEQSKIKGESTS